MSTSRPPIASLRIDLGKPGHRRPRRRRSRHPSRLDLLEARARPADVEAASRAATATTTEVRPSCVRGARRVYFPRCLSKKRAISSNASLVSGALASRMYCACDCPS